MKTFAALWIDHLTSYQDVFFIINYGLAIVMLSSLAGWKNRNPLAWGPNRRIVFPHQLYLLADRVAPLPQMQGVTDAMKPNQGCVP